MAKTKTSKKPMTLGDFAAAIQTDLARMATKDDIAGLRKDLWPMQRDIKTLTANLRDVHHDVKIITETMVSKADLANTLAEELGKSEHEKKIEDLRTRVNVLESKLGIKPAHRAA